MKAIQTRGNLDEHLSKDQIKIDSKRLKNVCKLNSDDKICRYIIMYGDHFVCGKHTPLAKIFDDMVLAGSIKATSDNCKGLGYYDKEKDKSEN
jgi:hypothetical protein